MNWVVDTCVIVDVLDDDAQFGLRSAKLLERLFKDGLAISPVSMIELAPTFLGNFVHQQQYFDQAGIDYSDAWTSADLEATHNAWHRYVMAKRIHHLPKRVIADLMIGGFASNRRGLITRNAADFKRWFPDLTIREP